MAKREWILDYSNERVIMQDAEGTLQIPVYDLPGRFITYCLIRGVAAYFKSLKLDDPREMFAMLKKGQLPLNIQRTGKNANRKPYAPPTRKPKHRTLTHIRQAIVATILDKTTTDRATVEDMVRRLSSAEVDQWRHEPEVIMHKRQLDGEDAIQADELAEAVQQRIDKEAAEAARKRRAQERRRSLAPFLQNKPESDD